WMYENLDLVVLGDGSFKDASPAARQALRRWLLGGGRLLIAAGEALPAAAAARLLPLDEAAAGGVMGADRLWWEKHAGLKADGVLFQKNERPVYIHLSMGFGEIVLVVPATGAEEAREYGAAAVNHPVLQRRRDGIPDLRVQPDRYAAFTPGVASAGLRGRAARWIGIGALVLCLGLALGYTSRSRLTAAAWPLVVAIFLAVLLAKWFPVRDLAVARVDLVGQSADGRALTTREWALVEAFNDPASVSIAGLVTPAYADTAELNSAQVEVALSGAQPRVNTVVYPAQPVLFTVAATQPAGGRDSPVPPQGEGAPAWPLRTLRSRAGDAAITFSAGPALQRFTGGVAVWVRADGSLHVLKNLDAGGAFDLAPFDDWVSTVRGAPGAGDEATARARATALGWASREALRAGRDALIVWQELPGEHGGLVELEPPSTNAGGKFRIVAVQAR
ncbi:MAG: hypothetical protein NTW87_30425, partial [Planctomycetota bacterium]|nr:hypothetical protein [Planctomycetota bacterium]